jgi:hypothetical protein
MNAWPGAKGFQTIPLEERFWAKVERGEADECWMWIGARNADGYGNFGVKHREIVDAHRVAYQLLVGPIPEGLSIDHLCRVRACVNPKHMEPVTHRENVLRGNSPAAANARKTRCPLGHPFEVQGNGRRCRECNRAGGRRFRIRRGIASAADIAAQERFDALQAKANAKRDR